MHTLMLIARFEDYSLIDGSLTVNSANQVMAQCVSIPIIDDNDPEPEECLTVFFFDMFGATNFDVNPNRATAAVCIADDDSGVTCKRWIASKLMKLTVVQCMTLCARVYSYNIII